jgi:hypothetical protein
MNIQGPQITIIMASKRATTQTVTLNLSDRIIAFSGNYD